MSQSLRPRASGVLRLPFRSRWLARMIFGVELQPLTGDAYYFDITTPVLLRRVSRDVSHSSSVLDMGTGTAAILALSIWKRFGCAVTASDVNSEILEHAQSCIDLNAAPIEVTQSEFFGAIEHYFDIVVFNPPYVPTRSGERRDLSQKLRSQWDGGESGTSVIAGFLESLASLDRHVRAYVGVNSSHVKPASIVPQIEENRSLRLIELHHDSLLPVDVYVVECVAP